MSTEPVTERRTVHHGPARPTARREALDEACGRRRRRTRNRGQ